MTLFDRTLDALLSWLDRHDPAARWANLTAGEDER